MPAAIALPMWLLTGSARAQQPAQPLSPVRMVPGQTPPIAPNVKEVVVPPPVTLPPPQARPVDVPNRPLGANEAVRIALRSQPSVAAARSAISAVQGRVQQVRAGLLPTVNLSAGYTNVQALATEGRSSTAATTGTSSGTSTGTGSGTSTGGSDTGAATGSTGSGSSSGGTTTSVSTASSGGGVSLVTAGFQASANLRQLIFDFNHTRDLVRQASLQERAAADNLARVQSDLVLQVKQAFYLYVQNGQIVMINEENVANRRAQLDLAKARLTSGLGLPADMVTAETALSEATTNLITARNNQTLASINLALIIGIDPRTPIDAGASAEPPVATNDVQGLVDTALKQRPEIQQAQNLIGAARYGVSAARTTNAPTIAGNIGVLARGGNFPPGNDSLSVGVTLQWNPFDGGLTAGRVKEARANVDTAQANLTGAQLTVISDVSQAYVNVRSAEQRLVSTETEIANAIEGVRIAQGRFGRGLGLFLDIINAQSALVTARSNRASAQFGVDQARAAVTRAIGAPLPR